MCKNQGRPHGFTLVELLVVITLIGVLIAMLIPALSQAKQVAMRGGCAANFHQVSVGSFAYAADNKQVLPSIGAAGFGSYGTMGSAGLGYRPGDLGHPLSYWVKNDPFMKFAADYMSTGWSYDTASQRYNVPKEFICPGLPETYLGPLYPGESAWNQGYHQIGTTTTYPWVGMIVGFGSFLGMSTPVVNGEGILSYSIRMDNARAERMTSPSDDPIFIDLLSSRWDIGHMNVPHGRPDKPDGTNEGYADGTVRWSNYQSLNSMYVPIYAWDRSIGYLLRNGENGTLLKGGYPFNYASTGYTPPDSWFGVLSGYCSAWTSPS